MTRLVELLQQHDIRLCATYLLESQFMDDRAKYFAGVMSAMSCMINLEVPHINIMSKMDLAKKRKRDLERFAPFTFGCSALIKVSAQVYGARSIAHYR